MHITDTNHVTFIVADLRATRHFYCDVLGMTEAPRPATFNFGGAWYRAGPAEIHVIQREDASQPPGDIPPAPTEQADLGRARHVGFTIENVDGCLRTLAQHNVPVVLGPRPRGDGAIQLYCYDPDGHLVELCTRP